MVWDAAQSGMFDSDGGGTSMEPAQASCGPCRLKWQDEADGAAAMQAVSPDKSSASS